MACDEKHSGVLSPERIEELKNERRRKEAESGNARGVKRETAYRLRERTRGSPSLLSRQNRGENEAKFPLRTDQAACSRWDRPSACGSSHNGNSQTPNTRDKSDTPTSEISRKGNEVPTKSFMQDFFFLKKKRIQLASREARRTKGLGKVVWTQRGRSTDSGLNLQSRLS